MDPKRFDTLARTLSASGTRRSALAALLSGSLTQLGLSQPAESRKRRGGRDVTIQGPCGDGSGADNQCRKPEQCCTGICERRQPGKPKRCRCRRAGQDCTETINCCQGAGQDLVCSGDTCQPRCTSDSCTTGCCDGTTCQEGNTKAACGEGVSCVSCSSDAAVSCRNTDGVNGTCVRDCAADSSVCGGAGCECLGMEGGGRACAIGAPEHLTCFDSAAACAAGCPSGRVCLDEITSSSPCPVAPGARACAAACAAT
jgi:hypothetical protein